LFAFQENCLINLLYFASKSFAKAEVKNQTCSLHTEMAV
jgi:hypothetical protein